MKAPGVSSRMDRRGFLKTAGIGSLTLATLTQVPNTAWAEGEQTEFTVAAQSRATIAGETHQVTMAADGRVGSGDVEGGGSFQHIRVVNVIPRPIVAAGRWKATRLVSFNTIGTFGVFAAGVLTMEIELIREIPSELRVPAMLEVVCNIGAAGLFTGKEEGFTLTASGVSFEPFGGITLFSIRVEEED